MACHPTVPALLIWPVTLSLLGIFVLICDLNWITNASDALLSYCQEELDYEKNRSSTAMLLQATQSIVCFKLQTNPK